MQIGNVEKQMIAHVTDGRFALALWLDPDSDGEEDDCEYAENADLLRQRAALLVERSRFHYAALYKWEGDWKFVEEYSRR